jgi:valyl-tRNA synthetase
MKRFDARKAMIQKLAQQGFIRGHDPLANARVPFCSRSGDVIEMLLKPQWYG